MGLRNHSNYKFIGVNIFGSLGVSGARFRSYEVVLYRDVFILLFEETSIRIVYLATV